jgi:hypothetical protein
MTASSTMAVAAKRYVTTITDAFTGSDTTNWGTRTTDTGGQVWATVGTWGLRTSRAYVSNGVVGNTCRALVEAGSGEAIVGVKNAGGTSVNCGFIARSDGAGNEYRITWMQGGAAQAPVIAKGVAGTYTTIATGAAVAVAFPSSMTVELVGDTITVKDDGVVIVSATDSSYSTQTKHGLYIPAGSGGTNGSSLDDFYVALPDSFQFGSVAMTASSTMTAAGTPELQVAVDMAATSVLEAEGEILGIVDGAVAMVATSVLEAVATAERPAAAALSATSVLTANATAGDPGNATVEMTATSVLTIEAVVYEPGHLLNPFDGSSPETVDFADATDTVDPAPVTGDALARDVWYRIESSALETYTLTWAGSFQVGLEVWSVPLDAPLADIEDASLLASGVGPTLSFSAGEGQAYLIRVHPTDDADNAGSGTLSWATEPRPSGLIGLEAEDTIYDTPSWLKVSVLSASADGDVEFRINGVLVHTATADETGSIATLSIPVDETVTPGTHTVVALDVDTGQEDSETFTVQSLTVEPGSDPEPGGPATPATGAVIRWVFELPDPGGMTFQFPHNPTEMTSPFSQRVLNPEHTTSPDGQPIIFEGEPVATEWSATGVVFTQAHYDALEQWHALNRRFFAIDHHERAWWVTLEAVDWTPMRDPSRPWAHRYTLKFLIWGGPYALEEVP